MAIPSRRRRSGTSRLGGVPTVLPPAAPGLPRQPTLFLPLDDPDRRTAPFIDVELRSGDLLVFGGPNRRIHHGVPRVASGTAPEGLGLPPGRLSITIRQTGLAPPNTVTDP